MYIVTVTRKDWNGLNHKVIRERCDELIKVDDYIPSHLRTYINLKERDEYLKTKGLYDKILKERKKKREELKKTNEKVEFHIHEILTFVNNNPVFEDFIKIKGRRYAR